MQVPRINKIVLNIGAGEAASDSKKIQAAQNDLTRARGIGATTREQWSALESFLSDYGAIPKRVDVTTVYNDSFVNQLYRNGKLIWP